MKPYFPYKFVIALAITIAAVFGIVYFSLSNDFKYKAASADTTMYLAPIYQVSPNTFKLTLTVSSLAGADILAVQSDVKFNKDEVTYVDTKTNSTWQVEGKNIGEGDLQLVLSPKSKVVHLKANSKTDVIDVYFSPKKKVETTSFSIYQPSSAVASSDSDQAGQVINILSEVQTAQVDFTKSASTMSVSDVDKNLNASSVSDSDNGGLIKQVTAIGLNDKAVAFVKLSSPSSVSVEYGLTTALGSKIDSDSLSQDLAVVIPNLTADKTYYYRIVVKDGDSYVASKVYSFTTATPTGEPISQTNSAIYTVPTSTDNSYKVYAFALDKNNKPTKTSFSVETADSKVTLTENANENGLYYGTLTRADSLVSQATINIVKATDKSVIGRYAVSLVKSDSKAASSVVNTSKVNDTILFVILVTVFVVIIVFIWFYRKSLRIK